MKSVLIMLALMGMTTLGANAQCQCNEKHDKHADRGLKPYKYTMMAGYVSKEDCKAMHAAALNRNSNTSDMAWMESSTNARAYTGYYKAPQLPTAPETPNGDVVKTMAPQSPNVDNYHQ